MRGSTVPVQLHVVLAKKTNTRVKITEETYGGICSGEPTEVESCLDVECPGIYSIMSFKKTSLSKAYLNIEDVHVYILF